MQTFVIVYEKGGKTAVDHVNGYSKEYVVRKFNKMKMFMVRPKLLFVFQEF